MIDAVAINRAGLELLVLHKSKLRRLGGFWASFLLLFKLPTVGYYFSPSWGFGPTTLLASYFVIYAHMLNAPMPSLSVFDILAPSSWLVSLPSLHIWL